MNYPEIKCWAGIDPGASGGLANIVGTTNVGAERMPATELGRWRWISSLAVADTRVIIEQVTGYVGSYGNEKQGNTGSSMFQFGTSYGGLRMALVAAGFVEGETFWSVGASSWQREIGIEPRRKGEDKAAFKNRLKAEAKRLFPEAKVTLATCDALLLAEVCRRRHVAAEPAAAASPRVVAFGGEDDVWRGVDEV
jgi:hypothetical protein